jgi:hypothetical protein
MQIHEITLKPISEGFMSGLMTGLGSKIAPEIAATDSGRASTAARPTIQKQAQEQMVVWNRAIADLLKASGVSSVAQLDSGKKQALSKSLMDMLNANLLQNATGNSFKNLPTMVDQKSQSAAKNITTKIEATIKSMLNWNSPLLTTQDQLAQWTELAQSAYDARALIQFNPNVAGGVSTAKPKGPPPKITQTPSGQYYIGKQLLDPRNPEHAAIISAIQAQQGAV